MFDSVRARINVPRTMGFVGAAYIVRRYILDRLEDVKIQMEEDRGARDNLKRRFTQTQSDTSYTILMLIPELSDQILREMDLDSITHELQAHSRARQAMSSLSNSVASSVELVNAGEPSTRPESRSESEASYAGSTSTQSWVETSPVREGREMILGESVAPVHLSDSLMTTTSTDTDSSSNMSSIQGSVVDSTSGSESSRPTKAELWNELKMLTFTRTLTTVYTTTLLSLLTTVQLTLLARGRYIRSVTQLEKQRRHQPLVPDLTMLLGLGLGFGGGLDSLLNEDAEQEGDYAAGFGWEENDQGLEEEEEMAAAKYLTMTWWILHVGWKDVGERVRRGVEEVFNGVSLKTKLGPSDLHRLIHDVRRRVEHEVTFEGMERKVDFHTTLLPQTPETTQHVLAHGGYASTPALTSRSSHKDPFTLLLDETREIISSPDFAYVFEACLDRATEVLLSSVENAVFASSTEPVAPGEEVRIRLAGLLPGLARWSHLALNGLPNELVDNILDVRQVSALSAIIFGRFEERFK
ncbi:Peroxin-3 [Roridomyces roridus]|uniref:Peroxin-3 n=1 Tax=Roridomyces roridus TaxID=1738132 RepID=A0AAD7CEM1_9AGAR|nr:Peroxin-3 [Roridomyces roridus]